MIKIEHLNKYYNKGNRNEYHVINDISYEFESKGLYVFFGPSGCGKTTLLNVIGALDKFDSGTITYMDQTLPKYKPSLLDFSLKINSLFGFVERCPLENPPRLNTCNNSS